MAAIPFSFPAGAAGAGLKARGWQLVVNRGPTKHNNELSIALKTNYIVFSKCAQVTGFQDFVFLFCPRRSFISNIPYKLFFLAREHQLVYFKSFVLFEGFVTY